MTRNRDAADHFYSKWEVTLWKQKSGKKTQMSLSLRKIQHTFRSSRSSVLSVHGENWSRPPLLLSFQHVSHYGCTVRTEELCLLASALFILLSFICKPLPICIRGKSTLCIPQVSFRIDSLELADVKVEPCGCLCVHLSVLTNTCDKALWTQRNGILMPFLSCALISLSPSEIHWRYTYWVCVTLC